jgi:hypothetical protein
MHFIDTAEAIPMEASRAAAFSSLLARFDSVSLVELEGVALLDRVDTKFLLGAAELQQALAALAGDYRVLEVAGTRLHHYRTRYFDTANFLFYRRHHAGSAVRQKVRSRAYLDSGQAFLEVKRKTATGRTVKQRLRTPRLLARLSPEVGHFLDAHVAVPAATLEPKLDNEFVRITLVGHATSERLTIDLDLRFHADGRSAVLPEVAVAEVKQARGGSDSALLRRMRAAHVRPHSVSKYCVGVALLYPDAVKHNLFKPTLRRLSEIMHGAPQAASA